MAPQFFILVALLLASLTLAAALFTAWLSFDRKPHALLWALALLLGALQWATNLFGSLTSEQFGLAWYGTAVPEPGTVTIALASLLGFGMCRRRRS